MLLATWTGATPMCDSNLWGASDGLVCLRTDAHSTGHVFGASWAPDEHDSYDPEADR